MYTTLVADHNDLVILTTALNYEIVVTLAILELLDALLMILRIVRARDEELVTTDVLLDEVVLECFAKHLSVVEDFLLSGGGHVISCVDELSIARQGAITRYLVQLLQVAHA